MPHSQNYHLRRRYLLSAYKLFNMAVMLVVFFLTTLLTYSEVSSASLEAFLRMRLEISNFAILLLLLAIWHMIFLASHVYQSHRFGPFWINEIINICKATTFGTLAIGGLGLLFQMEALTLNFLIVFWMISTTILIASRLIIRQTLKYIRKLGHNLNHVLIVGTNPRAVKIAQEIESRKEMGYHLVGFIDDQWWSSDIAEEGNYSRVANLKGVSQYLTNHVVDEVIICVPIKSLFDASSRIMQQCEEQGITVHVVNDAFRPRNSYSTLGIFAKRILDFLIALVLLVLLAPLMLLLAGLIKFDTPGPVFFVQKRVGLNKRIFNMYKFRTMVTNAEEMMAELETQNEASGPVFKIRNDPRMTVVGQILRKTSLDELPQIINVLCRDMSLVGPRPLPLRDYDGFTQDWHRRRLSVSPGITCLWQVQGRNSVTFDRWMELDMEYIDQWSFWLDLKIILKTIPAVMKGHGAS